MENNIIQGFKKYQKTSTRIIDKISITTGGALGFSTSFSKDHNLERYTAIELYWNFYTKEIGVYFLKDTNQDSIKLMKNKYGYGYTANAKAFFATNKINTSEVHGRYNYRKIAMTDLGSDKNGSMYIFKLEPQESGEEGGL